MTPNLHLRRGVLTLFPLLAGAILRAEPASSPEPDSLEALLAETEALVEGPLPFEKAPPAEDPAGTTFLLIGSVLAGPGYSSNYLKTTQAVDSFYLHTEADAWAGWIADTWSFSGFIYAESNLYEEEKEYLAYTLLTGKVSRGAVDYGSEMLVIYGDQVYDSSRLDINGIPTGTLIEEFMPELRLFADWFVTDRDRLRLEPGIGRAEFDIENQDYWEPVLQAEWEHLWSRSFRSETRLTVSREIYDDEVPREADGQPITDAGGLKVDRVELREDLRWEPEDHPWLETRLSAALAWHSDGKGYYKDLSQGWIRAEVRLRNAFGKWTINGRYMRIDYDHRQSDLTEPARQEHWSAGLEYEKILPMNLHLHLKASWADVESRTSLESYQETRGEALIEWQY